jgi:hypothetical protein
MSPADDEIELVAKIAVRTVHPEMQNEREKAERDRGVVEGEASNSAGHGGKTP